MLRNVLTKASFGIDSNLHKKDEAQTLRPDTFICHRHILNVSNCFQCTRLEYQTSLLSLLQTCLDFEASNITTNHIV